MAGDVAPRLGHRFAFGADWGHVDCEVVEVEPERRLAYSWDGKGLESTVTWTLTPTGTGTHLRMEQTGFRPDQKRAYHRSEEHTSEIQSLMRISYAVFCLKKKNTHKT